MLTYNHYKLIEISMLENEQLNEINNLAPHLIKQLEELRGFL